MKASLTPRGRAAALAWAAALLFLLAPPLFAGMDKTGSGGPEDLGGESAQQQLVILQKFFDRYWQAQLSNDPAEWGRLFGRLIHGGSDGTTRLLMTDYVTNAEFTEERRKLIQDYPERIYKQTSDLKITALTDLSATMRFSFAYHYTGRRRVIAGTVDITMLAFTDDEDGRLYHIALYRQEVKRTLDRPR